MASPNLILPLERALRDYIRSKDIVPDDLEIVCAHEAASLPNEYLLIQAARPQCATEADEGNYECVAEMSVVTAEMLNNTNRPDAIVLHDERSASLQWLFEGDDTGLALAALNANAYGIGFSGWGRAEDNPGEDGRTDEHQLASRLRFRFDIHRALTPA